MTNSKVSRIADLIEANDLQINDGYRAKNSELSKFGLPFARAQNINNGFHFQAILVMLSLPPRALLGVLLLLRITFLSLCILHNCAFGDH